MVVVQADITTLAVDAIVNAANEQLLAGGGVCGAIFRAAGHEELQEACDEIGYCETGSAVATPGFDLPATWVIHAVGPRWSDGKHGEPELLASCYRSILEVAEEIGAKTVAIPAISTGIFGFPADLAAEIAVTAIQGSSSRVGEVQLVAFGRRDAERYEATLAGLGAAPSGGDGS